MSGHREENRGPDEEGRKDREHLLRANTERVEQAYVDAKKDGMVRPAVIVVDAHDRYGKVLVETVCGADRARELIRDCEAKGVIPTLTLVCEQDVLAKALGPTSNNAGRHLSAPPPPGTFHVVAMASGGNLFAYRKIP
jgi:hypothetical protein